MACATAKKDGSSRYANSIRARSTRLAGSVRERAIAPNAAKSVSPIANSIACRHAVMSSTLSANQSRKPRTHVGKCESSTYDGFHGIDVLGDPRGHVIVRSPFERRAGPHHERNREYGSHRQPQALRDPLDVDRDDSDNLEQERTHGYQSRPSAVAIRSRNALIPGMNPVTIPSARMSITPSTAVAPLRAKPGMKLEMVGRSAT